MVLSIVVSLEVQKSTLHTSSGQTYLQTVANSRQKIAKIVTPFLRDGTVSLIVADQQQKATFTSSPFTAHVHVHVHVHVWSRRC